MIIIKSIGKRIYNESRRKVTSFKQNRRAIKPVFGGRQKELDTDLSVNV